MWATATTCSDARGARRRQGWCALALCLSPLAGHAALGEPASSIQTDQMHIGGQLRHAAGLQAQVHEIRRFDGSWWREYVSAQGVVFAVAWHGTLKPDLGHLLGAYYDGYRAATLRAARTPMIRAQAWRDGDLVVQESAHLHQFNGLAWVPSLAPVGFAANAAR
jgi:hypothetical protein